MAPDGPFDAATCLLTMHFVERKKRRRMAVEIRRRLRPGSPFVVVHMSIPDYEDEKARAHWLSRYAAFAVSSGVDPRNVDTARTTMESRLNILTPEHDEAILHEAVIFEYQPVLCRIHMSWLGGVCLMQFCQAPLQRVQQLESEF